MLLYGFLGYSQLGRHLFVQQSGRDQREDLALAGGQGFVASFQRIDLRVGGALDGAAFARPAYGIDQIAPFTGF